MIRFWPILALAACAILPWTPGLPVFWVSLLNYIGISSILVVGLVVLTGIGGMTSFAQASFMGFGAYASAILSTRYGVSPWLGLPAAIIVSALGAAAIGAVTLRLRGHYLALGTMAVSVSLYYLVANLDFFGRNDGLSTIPPLQIGTYRLTDGRVFLTLVWAMLVAVVVATNNLLDSRLGRAIRALRGGALAATSFGVNTTQVRMLAFIHAAILAAIAGWLYAHLQRSVNPTPFGLFASIEYMLMAVFGGAGYVGGAILGALLVTVINDLLQDWLPKLLGQRGNYETIVFGIILLGVLQFAPEGLWPHVFRGRVRRREIAPAEPLERRASPASDAPILAVAHLAKRFGGLVAVNDLSFAVTKGEIVGLIGPNGAGKSTSFNLITGVASPSAGSVHLFGQPITGLSPRAIAGHGVARSFQHVKLVPGMSVIENVAIGAHLRGQAGPFAAICRRDRAEEARIFAEAARQLDRVGLAGLADRPADSLALGQQRVVEIARALCLDPVLLLLDEPAAGLRHAEKAQLAALLRRLRSEGVAILLVEHDMEFVMGLVDRLVVMDFGTKLAEGSAEQIRRDPAVIEAYLGAA